MTGLGTKEAYFIVKRRFEVGIATEVYFIVICRISYIFFSYMGGFSLINCSPGFLVHVNQNDIKHTF